MDLCFSYAITGEFHKMADFVPKVIGMISKRQRQRESFSTVHNVYSILNAYYGWSLGWMGNFEAGKPFLEEALRFATEIDSRNSLRLIEQLYGTFFGVKGDGDNAIIHCQNSIRYIEEVKIYVLLGAAWTVLGWGNYLLGKVELARKHVQKGLQAQRDAGIPYHLSRCFLVLGMICHDSGDYSDARSAIKEAIEFAESNKEMHFEGYSRIWLGKILSKVDSGDRVKAEDYILKGTKLLDELKIKPWSAQGYLFLGEFYADGSQREKALANLKKAEGMFQEMGMDYWLAKAQEFLGRL